MTSSPGELIGAVKQIGGPRRQHPKSNQACESLSRFGLGGRSSRSKALRGSKRYQSCTPRIALLSGYSPLD